MDYRRRQLPLSTLTERLALANHSAAEPAMKRLASERWRQPTTGYYARPSSLSRPLL